MVKRILFAFFALNASYALASDAIWTFKDLRPGNHVISTPPQQKNSTRKNFDTYVFDSFAPSGELKVRRVGSSALELLAADPAQVALALRGYKAGRNLVVGDTLEKGTRSIVVSGVLGTGELLYREAGSSIPRRFSPAELAGYAPVLGSDRLTRKNRVLAHGAISYGTSFNDRSGNCYATDPVLECITIEGQLPSGDFQVRKIAPTRDNGIWGNSFVWSAAMLSNWLDEQDRKPSHQRVRAVKQAEAAHEKRIEREARALRARGIRADVARSISTQAIAGEISAQDVIRLKSAGVTDDYLQAFTGRIFRKEFALSELEVLKKAGISDDLLIPTAFSIKERRIDLNASGAWTRNLPIARPFRPRPPPPPISKSPRQRATWRVDQENGTGSSNWYTSCARGAGEEP